MERKNKKKGYKNTEEEMIFFDYDFEKNKQRDKYNNKKKYDKKRRNNYNEEKWK